MTHTFVLLDGEHGQSIDDLIGGQGSTQGAAKDILERDKNHADQKVEQPTVFTLLICLLNFESSMADITACLL